MKNLISILLVLFGVFGFSVGFVVLTTEPDDNDGRPTSTFEHINNNNKLQSVMKVNGLPNRELTPGAIFLDVTVETLKKVGYSDSVRNVNLSKKKRVFAKYNIPWKDHDLYEVDHLVPLELGGSNDESNLWPELYEGEFGARKKDVLETWYKHQVVEGNIELLEAQKEIADNWIHFYKVHIRE